MDFMLERWINRPAGTHPPLDALMAHVAGWAEPLFIALVILWFLVGWRRGLPRDRQGAITALSGAGVALLVNQVSCTSGRARVPSSPILPACTSS